MTQVKQSLKSLFNQLMNKRETQNSNFEDYAGWTLPYLYMADVTDNDTEAQHDYQSVGAQAVNHLANKMAKTLFPAGRPFFRMDLTKEQLEQLVTVGIVEEEIEAMLSGAEKEAMKKVSTAKIRTAILSVLKQLIVFGNSLMYFPVEENDERPIQVYNLRDYVVQRDMSGALTTVITRDNHQVVTLPIKVQALILIGNNDTFDPNREVELFTIAKRMPDGRFKVWQELNEGIMVPDSEGLLTEADLPWIALTWNLQRGANYGNGLVEEYAGDFHVLSSLSEALLVLSGIVSDIKILVDPMGSTDVDTLNESGSGTFIAGNAEDISYLQLEKFQDMRFLREQMQDYEARIGKGFLVTGSSIRDSERTTAEEVRLVANELEGSFGGVYSRLAEEMQQPMAKRILSRLNTGFKNVTPLIITGVESLSRTSELDEMMQFFNDLALLANLPERAAERLNFEAVIVKLGSARAIEYENLLLSEDEVAANRKAAAEAETAQLKAGQEAKQAVQPQKPI